MTHRQTTVSEAVRRPAAGQLVTRWLDPRLSVTGWPEVPEESTFLPLTVSTIPPGLPISMSTPCGNVHVFEFPPTT